jgi:hypothetical protein
MEILYLSPKGEKYDFNSEGEGEPYNFHITSELIVSGLIKRLPNLKIKMVSDLLDEGADIKEEIKRYDIVFCDITTMNPNIMFHAGQAESADKPIIYFLSNNAQFPVTLSSKRKLKYSEASLENEFIEELAALIELAEKNPDSLKEEPSNSKSMPKAFISYSHKDKAYLERLKVHLKPLIKSGVIDLWVDTKIKTGDKWREEIEKALKEANIAILMVSADFMASDFIVDDELPPLLSKAEVRGTKILPVIVSPCRFSRDPELSRFQAANSPDTPLSSMTEDEREKIYDQLAQDIEISIRKS